MASSHKRRSHQETPDSSPVVESSPLEAVTQLIAERQKYEKWLRDLEAKKDATPAHIFERVHADYIRRLKEVQEQLGTHATDMQKHAASLMSRLRDLEAAEKRLGDERAEAELRSHVGEMSRGDFDSAIKRADRELSRIQDEQQSIADDLNQIRSIVQPETEEESEEDMPRRSEDFDELEFLKSVVGAHQPAAPKAAAPPPAPAAIPTPAQSAPPVAAAPTQPISKEIPVIKPIGPPPRPQQKKDTSLASNVTGNHPIQLRNSGVVEQPKTLKCAECGSMNYPSEWYCEKCGGELANI
jgi:hypothetical protein